MRTIKLTLMYDGTNYVGWQAQRNGASIQALVQAAVRKMTGEENDVTGASRTDAGVHALGQVAHFHTERGIPADGFCAGLNAILPRDIAVVRAQEAPESFHARRDARSKRYVYRIFVGGERNPFLSNRVWQLCGRPDVQAMRRASAPLVGEHDFSSFRAAGCSSRHAVRTITAIEIVARPLPREAMAGEGELIELAFEGNGFLRHMIRNIVGTLVDVGQGRMAEADVGRVLDAQKRIEAGRCAPASGLSLVEVRY